MPYITKDARAQLALVPYPLNAGELNYCITKLVADYWARTGANYQTANDIVGALESAKAEFQRRVVAPYEDAKIKANGDVY